MKIYRITTFRSLFAIMAATLLLTVNSCTKDINIELPDSAQQVVVEGSIENNMPPIVILTKSVKFFDNINFNDLGSYFVKGADVRVTSSDGQSIQLTELCLQNLNLPPDDAQLLLSALGFTNVDSGQIPNVCVYTVPDIVTFFVTGTCSFMGKERTQYALQITAPPLREGTDSVKLNATTTIPTAIGLDSLAIRQHPNPDYRDSLVSVYGYFTAPDTFGNFIRYWTKRNSEPFYKPLSQSVYDDKLFAGLSIGLPLERGQRRDGEFNINTYSYFWKGDTVTVKWSNIDKQTFDFFYTLENDGGDSPFSSPVRIKTNIQNGLGVWAGYATKYSNIIVPK